MSFYRSQKCTVNTFFEYLENVLHRFGHMPCIFFGDSNIDALQNVGYQELSEILDSYDYKNCHNLVTRPCSKSSIDHMYSNLQFNFQIDSVECSLTDHNILHCNFESNAKNNDYVEVVRRHCNYERAKEYINNSLNMSSLAGHPSNDTLLLLECISNAVSSATVETKQRKPLKYELTPWINGNLQAIKNLKEKLLKRRRKGRPICEVTLKRISKVIKISSDELMNNYYQDNFINFKNEPRKGWRFLNQILGRKSKKEITLKDEHGETIQSDIDKADTFNDYFLESVANLKLEIEVTSQSNCNSLRTLHYHHNQFTFKPINNDEVIKLIDKLDVNKSAGSDDITPRVIMECREILSPFLTYIFNSSLSQSKYPDELKVHKIVPIPKHINSSSIDNFRPIALLSVIDKIFEKLLHSQLSTYLANENLMFKNQYGFQRGCGTEEAVVNVVNYICDGLDKGFSGVGGVFYDFSRAFDLVDHTILCQKLYFYGIRGSELELFRNYLYNRRQYVQINNAKSSIKPVLNGVPQGSVLGPLLFKLYLNDIANLELDGKLFMYADDLCVFYPYKENLVLKINIERDAALITEYARMNGLVLNAKKTKFVKFRPQPHRYENKSSIYVNGQEVNEVSDVMYLGINLQSNLSWKGHINQLRSKIAPALGILYKLKNKLDEYTKYIIFESLIQSHLNYLALVYGHRKNSDLKSLQIMQNKALKVVYNLPARYSTLSLYNNYAKNVYPVHGLYKSQLLIYVYKNINNIGLHTINIRRNSHAFYTRGNNNLGVKRCRLEMTKQRMEYIGCVEFNNLSHFIRDSPSISVFKKRLKKQLLQNMEMLLV